MYAYWDLREISYRLVCVGSTQRFSLKTETLVLRGHEHPEECEDIALTRRYCGPQLMPCVRRHTISNTGVKHFDAGRPSPVRISIKPEWNYRPSSTADTLISFRFRLRMWQSHYHYSARVSDAMMHWLLKNPVLIVEPASE